MENIFTAVPALTDWMAPASFGNLSQVCREWRFFTKKSKQIRQLLAWRFPGMQYILEETPDDWVPVEFVEELNQGLLDRRVVCNLGPLCGTTCAIHGWMCRYQARRSALPTKEIRMRDWIVHGYMPTWELELEDVVEFRISPFIYFFDKAVSFSQFELPNRVRIRKALSLQIKAIRVYTVKPPKENRVVLVEQGDYILYRLPQPAVES